MNYTANDIVSLSAGRAFREKIGMYLSADRQEAINLGLRELIVNVQDEYEVYKPENPYLKITISTKYRTICVEDNMRGIPVGIRDDGQNSLTAAFLIPHSGGKHLEKAYSSAIGVNGEGNKIVCHTAKWLTVDVKRDGKLYTQRFESTEEGATAKTDVIESKGDNTTGTTITYEPDSRVYGDCFIDIDKLKEMLKEISYFTKGLHIELNVDDEVTTFKSNNGLIDGLNKEFALSKPFSYFYETDDCKVELALQWVTKKADIRGYANGLYMKDGGDFMTSFKRTLTTTFNKLADKKFSGDVIRSCLDGFVSVKVRVGQFSNQAKTALANKEASTPTSTAINEALKDFAKRRNKDFIKVVESIERFQKAEVAAEKARKAALDFNKEAEKAQRRKVFNSDKLKDAEYLGESSTLLIVEGDSAAGGIVQARDYTKYGVLAIRGKMLNSLAESDEEKIYRNEEIKLLLKAMNIIPGQYNPDKLRYGKIAICTDADSDGAHIGLLIMANIYKFAPQFIKENRLCWLRSPLWINTVKGKEYYYFTDAELEKVRSTLKGTLDRNKGLGSLNPEQAHRSMFTEEFQRIDVIKASDDSLELLCSLMGADIEPRREYVFNNIDFSTIRE